jgi:DNA-binding CsgD family transcriptional regulator/tetratricopeptide (TPR) repeat protein
VFGARVQSAELAGLPEMAVGGLAEGDARVLLGSVLTGPVDGRVYDQIVAESHGNPLALLELPRGLTATELAGGFGLATPLQLAGRIEERFRQRLSELPPPTRRFLTVAAAEPTGDPVLVWRAADRLGVPAQAASPAIEAGLIEIGARVRFRHPTVRSAAYAAASIGARHDAHRALAEVTDPVADPDRRAWHLALAAPGPDAEVAAELERSAARAQARGGLAAAAALLERSAVLTLDPAERARRTIAAAGAHVSAGSPVAAAALLAAAEAGPLDELGRAQVELLRGDYRRTWGGEQGVTFYLRAAARLEGIDVRLARDTYLLALAAANSAGSLLSGAGVQEIARAARAAPLLDAPRPNDLLLDGLAMAVIDGPAAAAPTLRRALTAFRSHDLSAGEGLQWFGFACGAATQVWDHESNHTMAGRMVQAARELGALRFLPVALNLSAAVNVRAGDLTTAASLIGEAEAITEATGSRAALHAAANLAASRGNETVAVAVIDTVISDARANGAGAAIQIAQSARAMLYNGLGRYPEALTAAEEAHRHPPGWSSHLALQELVEAAVRSGQRAVADVALEQLKATTEPSGTDWALGIEARSRALLTTGDAAEALYAEAIDRLDRSPLRPEAARAHLLYGEWLRRERRPRDAREQLRTAHDMFAAMGMEAFAERARQELRATGETARRRNVETHRELTPQEANVAGLARDGLSNAEISARLLISASTVEYHLHKVFTKLNITSRGQLYRVLA